MELFHDHEMVRNVKYESLWDNLGMSDIMKSIEWGIVDTRTLHSHRLSIEISTSNQILPIFENLPLKITERILKNHRIWQIELMSITFKHSSAIYIQNMNLTRLLCNVFKRYQKLC